MAGLLKLPTLLLITDNPSIRHWIKKYLDDQFFIIDATTESSALLTTQTTSLDFVILDSHFEDCDALELCQKLRQINVITPVLLITGRLKKSYRDAALDAGVTDFLSGEIDLDELETRIATGRKAASARDKTTGFSSLIKTPRQELSNNFLKNKVLLNEKALRLLADAKKQQESVTLLILRIDHFETLETNLGLIGSEELLLPISDRLSHLLRPDDLLIPASEGRFIILLPHTSAHEARDLAEKMRKDVQQHAFPLQNTQHRLTISIAISTFEANEEQYKNMISNASKALKQAQAMTNLIISLDKDTP